LGLSTHDLAAFPASFPDGAYSIRLKNACADKAVEFPKVVPMDFACKIAAQAGAGVMVTGRLLVRCFSRGGYNVVGYPEYPSLIRGGHNTVQVRISDKPVSSPSEKQDLLIALNKDAVFYQMPSMSKGGAIIYDELIDIGKFPKRADVNMYPLPLSKLTQEAGGTEQMKNMAALGASLAMIRYPFDVIEHLIRDEFGRKGEEVVKKNIDAAKAGYNHVKSSHFDSKWDIKPLRERKQLVITGNEAIALGALRGGMKFYAAYPMTPASSILHYLVENDRAFNIVVKQTEDEIAAINYAIGASFAGARAMTGTSGGGFALMVEALGMAAMSETPIVVVISQRSGPSTGLPTWTEQGDLGFAIHASQGDFPRVVLAPGDVQECFYLSAKALNLAEKYQVPVIVLSDKHLSETIFSTELFNQAKAKIERGKIVEAKDLAPLPQMSRWHRYALTEDGVSPRTLPGTPNGEHVASSYEHDQTGFSSESFIMRSKQVDKRAKKMELLLKEMAEPTIYGPRDAKIAIVGWGSTKLAAIDALAILEKAGVRAKFIHFTHVYPLDPKIVKKAFRGCKVLIDVENNSAAQFAQVVKESAGAEMDFHILKYDARPFFPEQIAEEVGKLAKNEFKGEKRIEVVEKEDMEYYNTQRYGL